MRKKTPQEAERVARASQWNNPALRTAAGDGSHHGRTNRGNECGASEKAIGQTQCRDRSQEFRSFLDTIERNVPPELNVHLILDNYGTHKTQRIRD
jgi:hypothetical protein